MQLNDAVVTEVVAVIPLVVTLDGIVLMHVVLVPSASMHMGVVVDAAWPNRSVAVQAYAVAVILIYAITAVVTSASVDFLVAAVL